MATKSAASVTKAPAKKTTKKPAERKLLPKKRQPLGPVAHNSRQIKPKVKRTEVIDLSVEDEDEQPLQKGLRRGVEDRKKLHDEEPERESEPGRLLSGTGVVHMSPTEKSIGKVKGKGKAIDIPGLATSAIKIHFPSYSSSLNPPITSHNSITLPPPLMSPATNLHCSHAFTKYRSIPVGFGALNLARGDKPYAGDAYIDELVDNDMKAFKKRHVEGYWRRSVEKENDWPVARIWEG